MLRGAELASGCYRPVASRRQANDGLVGLSDAADALARGAEVRSQDSLSGNPTLVPGLRAPEPPLSSLPHSPESGGAVHSLRSARAASAAVAVCTAAY